jgi:hypothetical protein
MLLANQSGFFCLNSHAIRVTWNGGVDKSAIRIEYKDGIGPGMATSHFGSGILTFSLPYLFHTSPGYNLLMRGPANLPKDGISPLEGLIESDWTTATATMNWKITCKNEPITFEVGEPICMLVPQKRGELESFQTHMQSINEAPEMLEAYTAWSQGRSAFLNDLKVPGSDACKREWQKDYFQGKGIEGHQTKLKLCPFAEKQEESANS